MDKHKLITEYIESSYDQLIKMASKISGGKNVEDIVADATVKIYSANIPDEVFEKNILNFYFYRTIQTIFYKSIKRKEYLFQNEWDNELEDTTDNDFTLDYVYPDVLKQVKNMIRTYEITNNDGILFILYYYPNQAHEIIDISHTDYQKLITKQSFRRLEQMTNIKWQTIRYAVKHVLQKIKLYYEQQQHLPSM